MSRQETRRVIRLRHLLVLTGLILVLCRPAGAQIWDPDPTETIIQIAVRSKPAAVSPGEQAQLLLEMTVAEGWMVYSLDTTGGPQPTQITLAQSGAWEPLGGISGPKPKRKFDEGFGIQVGIYRGTVIFERSITISAQAREPVHVRGELIAQGCSETTCLAPESFPFELTIPLREGDATASPPTAEDRSDGDETASQTPQDPSVTLRRATGANTGGAGSEGLEGISTALLEARIVTTHAGMQRDEETFLSFLRGGRQASEPREKSGFWVLIAGFLSGLLALATPCVYPMIPITVSFFSKLGAERGGRSLGPALVYCLGIVLSFTLLGLVLTLILGASGTQDFGSSPWINGAVGLLFLLFAFALFGMFELQLPRFLTKLGGAGSAASGYTSVLLMGLTFAVTSFACTGPFIGAILAGAATEGYLAPTLAMIGFSTALALPFFFLALIPQVLAGLPKSGGWMVSVKVVMGFLLLAASFKFFANADEVLGWGILNRTMVVGVFMAVALLTAFYLLGLFRFRHEDAVPGVGSGRVMLSLLFLALFLRMIPALFGAGLGELDAFLPGRSPQEALLFGSGDGDGGIDWMKDLEAAERLARAERKPLFLNFTGHTCGNCKWMKSNMFTRPSVVREMGRFVAVELYTDRMGDPEEERNRRLRRALFRTVAIPFYAVVELSPR